MGKKLGHSLQAPRPSGSPKDVDTHRLSTRAHSLELRGFLAQVCGGEAEKGRDDGQALRIA